MPQRRVLVTAGPTREYLDPVRFIGNRSSGRMGYAVAEAAQAAGLDVRLISGPVAIPAPEGMATIRVETAAQMLDAVLADFEWCDALVMAAAVADWRPARVSASKLKKELMRPCIELERTADILATVAPRKGERIVVGFAAETDTVVDNAREKLKRKNLDLIVANDISAPDAGFEVETNRIVLIDRDRVREFDVMPKRAAADVVVSAIISLWNARRA